MVIYVNANSEAIKIKFIGLKQAQIDENLCGQWLYCAMLKAKIKRAEKADGVRLNLHFFLTPTVANMQQHFQMPNQTVILYSVSITMLERVQNHDSRFVSF